MLLVYLRKFAITSTIAAFVLAISLTGVPTARAVELGPAGLGLCFSGALSGAQFVSLDGSGNVGIIAPTYDVTVQADDNANGLSKAVIKITVELLNDTGARIWQRSGFTVKSNDIVSAIPGTDDVSPFTFPMVPTRHFGFVPFPFVCEGYGIVESGGQRYLFVASGVAGVDGDTGDTDQTIVKVWIVNLANGNIIRTHRIVPQGGKFALVFDSGIADLDNDGDDELVVIRSSFLGTVGDRSRFRLTFEVFNLLTGIRERIFNTIVSDTFVNDNPLP